MSRKVHQWAILGEIMRG